MSEAKQDGGSAFPIPNAVDFNESHTGMSLRQWYAGKAMQGMFSTPHWPRPDDDSHIATRAFQIADAMIREGQK